MTANNKYFKKYLSAALTVLLTAVLSLSVLYINADAEETEAVLFNNDKVQDVSVFIEYEKNDITFKLIAPSGAEITKDTDTDNVTVFSGSTSTIVFIGDAEAGQWKIKYDKGSNDNITVSANVQNSDFWITAFNKGSISNGKLPVTFTVSGEENTRYDYSLMLTTDKQSLSGMVLDTGSAEVNNEVSTELSFDKVSTYSGYHLLLYVSCSNGSSEIFDYGYSDAFDYTNPDSPEAIDGVDISIAHDSGSITADWGNHISYDIESVFVEYYIDDKLISSEEYPTADGHEGFFTYEDEASSPVLKISVRTRDGLVSDYAEFKVPLQSDDSLSLTLPESGIAGSEIWSFDYKNADNTEVTFQINGTSETYTLDGNGSKYLTLPDVRNTILVSYKDANGYTHTYNRMANISSAAPTLELVKTLDGVSTENEFIIISGKTNAAALTINDEAVTVTDGLFTHVYSLDKGKNTIVINASTGDSSTSMTASVTRRSGGILSSDGSIFKKLLPLIIGLAISALFITLTVVMSKKRNSRKADMTKENADANVTAKIRKPRKPGFVMLILTIISWTATIGLWVWFIIRKIFENSTGFITLAYESLSRADSYLLMTTILMIAAIILSVAAVAFTSIFVIIRMTKKN